MTMSAKRQLELRAEGAKDYERNTMTDTQIATTGPQVAERQATNLLDVIRFAVSSPDVDVAKLREIVELQERMERRNAEVEYAAAMARVQAKIPRITKGGVMQFKSGAQIKYAKYEDIDAGIRSVLADEGLAFDYDAPKTEGRFMTIAATVRHRLGHAITKTITLPLDEGPGKSPTQAALSTMSYGKRGLIKAFFNIIEEGEEEKLAGNLNEPISTDQQTVINDLMAERKANKARFLQWVSSVQGEKVTEVAQIRKAHYSLVIDTLKRKAAK
jgi:hypothetical protein